MNVSDDGMALLKEHEGYGKRLPDGSCTAYQERLNGGKLDIPTIGWGCTEGVHMGMVWTVAEAEAGLRRELAKHEAIVTRLVTVPLTQHQFDALVSFSYNVGKLGGSTLLKKLNAGDTAGAGDQFMAWTKAGGHEQPGLVRRRSAERALFLKPDAPEHVPQTAEEVPLINPLHKSGTLGGISLSLLETTTGFIEKGLGILTDAATKFNDLQPVHGMLSQVGANAKAVSLGLISAALVYAASRRVKASEEGKAG